MASRSSNSLGESTADRYELLVRHRLRPGTGVVGTPDHPYTKASAVPQWIRTGSAISWSRIEVVRLGNAALTDVDGIRGTNPHLTRSSLHRCLKSHCIGFSRCRAQQTGQRGSPSAIRSATPHRRRRSPGRTGQAAPVGGDRASKFAFVELHETAMGHPTRTL
jgi:hypothetical protein